MHSMLQLTFDQFKSNQQNEPQQKCQHRNGEKKLCQINKKKYYKNLNLNELQVGSAWLKFMNGYA